jgi:hypothetical protein
MDKEQELTLLKITAQYVAEVQTGQQPRLSDYLSRYPRYADAIADFVAYYHTVEEGMVADEAAQTDAVESTDMVVPADAIHCVPTIHAIHCQDDGTCQSPRQSTQAEAMTTLLTTAVGQQLMLSQVATELDLSRDIILLLEQRALASATIPHALCEEIAVLLQQPSATVQQYLDALDQREPGSAVQKGKQHMQVAEDAANYPASSIANKPSFRAIIETSLQLSVEQRDRWRAVLDAEGL